MSEIFYWCGWEPEAEFRSGGLRIAVRRNDTTEQYDTCVELVCEPFDRVDGHVGEIDGAAVDSPDAFASAARAAVSHAIADCPDLAEHAAWDDCSVAVEPMADASE